MPFNFYKSDYCTSIHGLSNHEMVLEFDEMFMVWSVDAMGVASLGELPSTEERCELTLDF